MTAPPSFSKARLEALSDGVYAVALTLLALDLKLPALDGAGAAVLSAALGALAVKGLVWLLSFWVGTLFWLAQNRTLAQYGELDRVGLLIELAQLGLITLLPFSTALMGEHGATVVVALIYSLHLALLALLALLRVSRLARKPSLRATGFDAGGIGAQVWRARVVLGCALAAVLLAFVVPGWNMLAMLGIAARRRLRR